MLEFDNLMLLLCGYGLMFVIKESKLPGLIPTRRYLIQKSRHLMNLLTCSFCLGFHTGWASYLMLKYFRLPSFGDTVISMVIAGLASATFCYIVDTLMLYIESHIKNGD